MTSATPSGPVPTAAQSSSPPAASDAVIHACAGFDFASVGRVVCRIGSSAALADHMAFLSLKNVLLVTDAGVVQHGLHQAAQDSLIAAGVQVSLYSDVQADPPEAVVLAAAQHARAQGVDGVIGFGGGSSMDVAKLIAVLAHPDQTQPLQQMYGVNQVTGPRLPLVQVPTTAGTGSEVTPIAIVTTGTTTKSGIVAPQLLADLAVLDAQLTVGLPPAITAATGIDAMVHAIEAYTSRGKHNPYSDLLAREALRLLDANLQTAIHHGHDLTARQNMLLGALLAGQAFANAPVAAVHALAYPLGGHFHLPHGLSNALVLLEVLRFNLPAAAHRYAALMRVLDPHAPGGDADLAQQLIDRLEDHLAASPLPRRLRELSIPEAHLPVLAADAMQQTRLLVNNPRELGEADALAIYQAVF